MKRFMATMMLFIGFLPLVHAAQPVHAFERDSLAKIEAMHHGTPFVLMLWSLDCVYCPTSFATLAEAQKKRGLKIVTIASDHLDDGDNARLIADKLDAFGMRRNAWAFGVSPPEQLRYAIDPKWRGEVPRSYWYDATGARSKHSGTITPDMIADFLQAQ